MPWVKLTDDWYDDGDIAAVGPLGLAMWVTGVTWCARNLTDGHIPRRQARRLIDLQGIAVDGEPTLADDVASQLVEVGLWAVTDTGYLVRNYHRYQPSREKVLTDREKDRKRKTSRPDSSGPSDDPPTGIRAESGGNRSRPVPVPDSDPVLSSSRNSRRPAEPVENPPGLSDVPPETWEHFADLRLKMQTGTIAKPEGWKRKTAKNAQLEHGANAARWWATYDISPYRLAQCLIDGQAPRHVRRRPEAS